jgi:hypothetical protein
VSVAVGIGNGMSWLGSGGEGMVCLGIDGMLAMTCRGLAMGFDAWHGMACSQRHAMPCGLGWHILG